MKYITCLFVLSIFIAANLQAQTLEEAQKLYAEKKYDAAASMYYQLYLFNDAADAWQMQMDLLKEKKPQEAEALKPMLIQAEKAARMVSRCENIQIIDSLIVNKNDFLSAYLMGEEAGALEKTVNSVIHKNQLQDRRYFGKRNENGRFRLNTQIRIQDDWSEERVLNLPADTLGDDNFPFVMPDGMTVYYASTGNESIGGYDIFVSRYNRNNNTYLAPNQMGMPFNSIYNDYMLAIDEVNDIGYFATDRFQPEDRVIVYTFIPNEEFYAIESEDEQTLIERAKISSIRNTWVEGIDYQANLEKIKTNIDKYRQKIKKDFTFVINDNIVYYTLTDFDSDAAKKSFLQTKDLEGKIVALEMQLDVRRQEYAAGNTSKKQSMTASILANEKRLEDLYKEQKKAVTDTRNLEIKYLRQKQ
ncbi:hypothetical protein FACS18947_1820 [Bacteroidia bacterium]|nr:hypothetical protein FACS18947_1820 [Bacteroidia bacterium]